MNVRLGLLLDVISGCPHDVRLGRPRDGQIGSLGDVLGTLEGGQYLPAGEFPKFYEQFLKKTIESISISIFLFEKTSERISISIFLFDQDKLQFSRLRVLVTEFPSPKSHFSGWWIQQLLNPTKDQFPLHGVDKAFQWALGTASGY